MSENKYQTVSQIIAERDSLRALNAELLKLLETMKQKLRIDDPLDMYDVVCETIAKANAPKGESHEQS